MKQTRMEGPDLRLLSIFDEIYKTRSVSRAAQNLGLSQPTLSVGLARLRSHFGDAVFVRTSTGMAPTPLAQELVQPIRQALELLDRVMGHRATFDASTSARIFRVCMTDISQIEILPRLLESVRGVAPDVRIEVAHLGPDTARRLESGEADLAVGFMPQLEAGFYQQKLFDQDYVCVASSRHPRVRDRLTRQQFEAEGHIVVMPSGTGHGIVDRVLEEQGVTRRIALRLPSYLGLGTVVASTDLIVTVPRRLGELLVDEKPVRLLEPPVALPAYQVKQHWHERYHHDPGSRWLRGVLAARFVQASTASPPAASP